LSAYSVCHSIGVIVIYERPYGHIVNYKINLSCLENVKNTSKIKLAWWAVKSAYMNNHVQPSRKPKYKKNLSSIWIIHSIISHAKKESTEGWKGKYEEEKDKESLSVWVSLHSSGTTKSGQQFLLGNRIFWGSVKSGQQNILGQCEVWASNSSRSTKLGFLH